MKKFKGTRKSLRRVDIQASLVCCILVVISCLAVFFINYESAYTDTIESLRERTDAIYHSLDHILNEDVFDQINTREDADTEIYKEYQERLSDIREVSTVRYLYTAKKNANGDYIYAVDGLPLDENGVPLDEEDFRFPGDLIEEEIIEDINNTYTTAEPTLPDDIIDTEWGKIFLAYYPIHRGNAEEGEAIGVIGIEIDAENQAAAYNEMKNRTPFIIIIACIVAYFAFSKIFKYISNPRRRDLYNIDGLTKLKNRASFEVDLENVYKDFTQMSFIIADLDRLKEVNDKHGHAMGDEYIQIAAKIINDFVDKSGAAYRIGGDEFVAVVDNVDEENLKTKISMVDKEFDEQIAEKGISGGLSIGFAIYDKNLDISIRETIKRADDMMYKNKDERRSRYK